MRSDNATKSSVRPRWHGKGRGGTLSLSRDDAGPFLCAACKSPLVARRGDINICHFAHKTEGNCETAFETAVPEHEANVMKPGISSHRPQI
ncbi:competence protein CoiA family protein [Cupriavidus basilensis]|uniref:competence protein CoiA family protein n=1 Tax=Cupriavidus basilensis TaxID=68895 RepID=UPI0011858C5D